MTSTSLALLRTYPFDTMTRTWPMTEGNRREVDATSDRSVEPRLVPDRNIQYVTHIQIYNRENVLLVANTWSVVREPGYAEPRHTAPLSRTEISADGNVSIGQAHAVFSCNR